MKCCPICREPNLESDDVKDATWVALGRVVCSYECHREAYHRRTDIDGEPTYIDYASV